MLFLRPTVDSDIDTWVTFNDNGSDRFLVQWAGPTAYRNPLTKEQVVAQRARETDRLFFTILEDDRIIGTIEMVPSADGPGTVRLCRFLLAPDCRGKGYGGKALALAVDYAKRELKAEAIFIGAYDYNPGARRCYEKFGFRPVQLTVDDLGNTGCMFRLL